MVYMSDLPRGAVTVRKVARKSSSELTVLYDPNFLASGFARKMYVAVGPELAVKQKTHKHPAPQMTCLIQGQDVRLAYEDLSGKTVTLNMEPGNYFYIAPDVPHQFEARGPLVLESFMPTASYIEWIVSGRKKNIEVLDLDLIGTPKT